MTRPMPLRRSLTLRTSGDADRGYRLDYGAGLLDADGYTVWSMSGCHSQDDPLTEAKRRDIVDALLATLDAQARRRLARIYGDLIRV